MISTEKPDKTELKNNRKATQFVFVPITS